MNNPQCDTESGVCAAPALDPAPPRSALAGLDSEVVYIGDPMCSWCWGLAPGLRQLQRYCREQGLPFRLVVGGLRPGGGDPWNPAFRGFLRHHWQEVSRATGQPFSYRLLERDAFEYDTEPACRAVVAARPLIPNGSGASGAELDFFAAVQRKFYVDNEDPKEPEFYRGICASLGVDFDAFVRRFESAEVRAATREEFQLNRSWGVNSYPTVLVRVNGRHAKLVNGYATFEEMQQRLRGLIPQLT